MTIISVSKQRTCEVCGGDHKCAYQDDGLIYCGRRKGVQSGFINLGPCRDNENWNLYRRDSDPRNPGLDVTRADSVPLAAPEPMTNWSERLRFHVQMTNPTDLLRLQELIGIPMHILRQMPVGYQAAGPNGPNWITPERNALGEIIGLSRHYLDGSVRHLGRRGLCYLRDWYEMAGPVFCPEGVTDTMALAALLLCAVGRPNANASVQLADLLSPLPPERLIVIVGERDQRDGAWPGRDGAIETANQLSHLLHRRVYWTLPPEGFKDVRAWVVARRMDPLDSDEWFVAGGLLETELMSLALPHDVIPAFLEPPAPLNQLPTVPTFPLDSLPGELRRFVAELAHALGCPLDYVGVPVLALAGGALGNAWRLRLTASHQQPPALFCAVVGPPGSAKSPALAAVAAPLQRINGEWFDEMQTQRETADRLGVKYDVPPRRVILDDYTTEALPPILDANPKGVVVVKDELAGLIHSLNQYKGGRGSDRQVLLSLWAGSDIIVDRKSGSSPIHVQNPFLAIVGGIQPTVLPDLRPKRGQEQFDDGLLDRFLYAYPEPMPATRETWRELSAEVAERWSALLRRLVNEGVAARELRTRELAFTDEGRREWETFTVAHAEELNGEEVRANGLAGVWSKMRGYCARLSLIVQALRWAVSEAGCEGVDGESVRAAVRLVDYFKGHARRVFGVLQTNPAQAGAEVIVSWLSARPTIQQFTRGELYQHLRRRFTKPQDMLAPLEMLVELRYLRRIPTVVNRWQVNPLWRR